MNAQNKEIRLNAGRLIAYYAPLFAEQRVVLDYQLRRFTQFSPNSRDYDQRRFDKALHNISQWLRKLFTGKKPVPYRGDEAIAEVWALILTFSTMDKTSKIDYALPYRIHVRNEKSTIRAKRLFRQAERLLKRKLRQANKIGSDRFCHETWWDVLRYIFGNYGYMHSVKGVSLTLIHFGLFSFLMLIFFIIEIILEIL